MTVGGLKYGIQPQTAVVPTPTTLSPYAGGKSSSNAPYAIYWDPADVYSGVRQVLTAGLQRASAVKAALPCTMSPRSRPSTGCDRQQRLPTTRRFTGPITDVEPYKTAGETTEQCTEGALCLTDAQIRAQLTKYISANPVLSERPQSLDGPTPIYFMFTSPNVTVCP